MAKSPTTNQRWSRVVPKLRQLMRLSRPYEKPETSGLCCAKTGSARKQRKQVLNHKLPSIREVCEANRKNPGRAEPQRSIYQQYRNMQRKRAQSNRLPPIPEDCEIQFEEVLKAEPRNTESRKEKIHTAKRQQHCQVRDGLEQEKRTSMCITSSIRLDSLVAIWTNHGGSVIVMVLLGILASSLVC